MTPHLETARLLLRPLELADADQIQVLFPHWEIVRYLDRRVPWPYPPNGAYEFLRDIALPAAGQGAAWHWTLRLKTASRFLIGMISLQRGDKNRGFWLALPWQGQGLMTEAARAVTDYWFGPLGFPLMRVPKAAPNAASRRISEKQGMRLVGVTERDFVSGRLPAEIWEITAEEWTRARA
jgi:RimJ/RimL family protein N-acetyltransferase